MLSLLSVFSARRSRIKRVREGLENSLRGRIELIDSYARVCLSTMKTLTTLLFFLFFMKGIILIYVVLFIHQISSMIEIEVEMDSDVLAAEAASNAVSTSLYINLLCLYQVYVSI